MIQLLINNENSDSDSGSNSLSDYPTELVDENNIFTALGIIIIIVCSVCIVMLFCEICRNNIRRNRRFIWNNINRDDMIL
tara:strand:- start:1507 stop:1746 length:240 start_codon:yes stop_codon:yes gene_type:complete